MTTTFRSFFYSHKMMVISSFILGIIFIIALIAPYIIPNDPTLVDSINRLQSPSWNHYPLGTDHLGRCIFSRILFGARISLGYALIIFCSALGIGLVVGVVAGYVGGWVDQVLMRFADGLMSIPSLIFVLGFVGIWGAGPRKSLLGSFLYSGYTMLESFEVWF